MPDTGTLKRTLERQYRAALGMLRSGVELCPDALWYDATPTNAYWQLAYHTLFFTHFYLQPTEDAFQPWHGHQRDVQWGDGIPGPADPTSPLPLMPRVYSRDAVLEYWAFCDGSLSGWLDAIDLDSPTSGFSWYPVSKLEHQLVNLRHIQHHAAQLADRLRAAGASPVDWIGSGRGNRPD